MTEFTRRDELHGFAARNERGVTPPVTIRRWSDKDGVFYRADVFVGGWRVGTYRTEAGAIRRADREVRS